jgi:hypothetical protein
MSTLTPGKIPQISTLVVLQVSTQVMQMLGLVSKILPDQITQRLAVEVLETDQVQTLSLRETVLSQTTMSAQVHTTVRMLAKPIIPILITQLVPTTIPERILQTSIPEVM